MNKIMSFTTDKDALQKSLDFIEECLKELKVNKKLVMKNLIYSEEVISLFLENARPDSNILIQVKKFLGDASISIHSVGDEVTVSHMTAGEARALQELEGDKDTEVKTEVRSVLFKAMEGNLKMGYKNGMNNARILVGMTQKSVLFGTVVALIASVVFGLMLKHLFSEGFTEGTITYLLEPIRTMFMNSLRIVIGPVIFFSIVSCFSQFKNLSELGRIGAKVIGMYVITSIVAVFLAWGLFNLIDPGETGFALRTGVEADLTGIDMGADTSILKTIVNIVPSNFVAPFVVGDSLQIIFLAVICGVAVGMIGEYSNILQEFFEACNSLFITITSIFAKAIPLAIFSAITIMIVELNESSFLSVLGYLETVILAIACMLTVYAILIFVTTRLNPITFYKKQKEGMITSFVLASSSASLPTNMKIATNKLGISPKVSSFSLPLGATINMDGTCIMLMIDGLFLAKAYGVQLSPAAIMSMMLTVLLLSVGAPGIPGVNMVCLGVVVANIGLPIESIGILMGVNSFLEMFDTMNNTTGDATVATIVANSEGLLDRKIYNS